MTVMKLLQSNWVTSTRTEEELAHLKDRAAAAEPVLSVLLEWAEREKATIDTSMKHANIKEKPNRAELALIAYSQQEILDKLIKLLDKEDTGE